MQEHSKSHTGRVALYVFYIICLLLSFAFGRRAEAGEQKVSFGNERTLGILGSLAQDPDAVACVRRACLEIPYGQRTSRHARIEACKHEHYLRIAWVLGAGNEPRLRSYRLTDIVPTPEELMCAMVTGQPEPSFEEEADIAFLREQERRLAELKAERDQAERLAAAQPPADIDPVAGDTGTAPASVKRRVDPELRDFVSVEDALRKASVVVPTGPDKQNVARCAPEYVTVLESNKDSAKLYVDAGAAYDAIVRSCLSKDYRTDAVPVVEENSVEKTIPACMLPGGRIELDPTRYAEILSGKRKLDLGGPPNLEFHKECQAKGGKPWLALQGRQVLYLAGKDKPRRVWPSTASAPSGIAKDPIEAAHSDVASHSVPSEPVADAGAAFAPSVAAGQDASWQPAPLPVQQDAAPCAPSEEGDGHPAMPGLDTPGTLPPAYGPDAGLNLFLQPRYWDPFGLAPESRPQGEPGQIRNFYFGTYEPPGSVPGFWPRSGAGPPSPK